MSLLEEAKNDILKKNYKYTDDEIELAVAWARKEIGIGQVSRALKNCGGAGTYVFLALALAQYLNK